MSARIGQFFLYIGLIVLVIFVATSQAQRPAFSYLCGGGLSLVFGIFLIWRVRRPPPEAGRFRLLRKSENRPREKMSQKK
jgi:hypothetical protein